MKSLWCCRSCSRVTKRRLRPNVCRCGSKDLVSVTPDLWEHLVEWWRSEYEFALALGDTGRADAAEAYYATLMKGEV